MNSAKIISIWEEHTGSIIRVEGILHTWDGNCMVFRSISKLLLDYMVSHLRGQQFSLGRFEHIKENRITTGSRCHNSKWNRVHQATIHKIIRLMLLFLKWFPKGETTLQDSRVNHNLRFALRRRFLYLKLIKALKGGVIWNSKRQWYSILPQVNVGILLLLTPPTCIHSTSTRWHAHFKVSPWANNNGM
jgi:hypothetical protein